MDGYSKDTADQLAEFTATATTPQTTTAGSECQWKHAEEPQHLHPSEIALRPLTYKVLPLIVNLQAVQGKDSLCDGANNISDFETDHFQTPSLVVPDGSRSSRLQPPSSPNMTDERLVQARKDLRGRLRSF